MRARYYGGEVVAYDPERRLHRVHYDDSEEEWVDLVKERHSIVKPAMAPVLPSLSTPSELVVTRIPRKETPQNHGQQQGCDSGLWASSALVTLSPLKNLTTGGYSESDRARIARDSSAVGFLFDVIFFEDASRRLQSPARFK